MIGLIIGFGVFYFVQYIKKSNPNFYFYNRYIEDAGTYPLSYESLFHYIIFQDSDDGVKYHNVKINPDEVNIIGLDVAIPSYEEDENLEHYNHWLYGDCDNTTDTKGIGYLITNEIFDAACIKKYYDKETKKYYSQNEDKFKWPKLAKGMSNPEGKYYGIVVQMCRQAQLDRNKKGYSR